MSPISLAVLPAREGFGPDTSGAVALYVRETALLSRLKSRLVVCGYPQDATFPGLTFQGMPLRQTWLYGTNGAYLRAICDYVARHPQIRLLEVHNRPALALKLKARLPGVKVMLFLHNHPDSMKDLRQPRQRQRVMQQLDQVIFVSEYLKAAWKASINVLSTNLKRKTLAQLAVVPNALSRQPVISPEGFDAFRQNYMTRPRTITFVGRFIPEKGIAELAQALVQILPDYPDWQVNMVGAYRHGQQALAPPFEQHIAQLLQPVMPQVNLTGFLPQGEVWTLLGQSQLAVVPTRVPEAFGRSALEAAAQGCAVLSSGLGGLQEVLGPATVPLQAVTTSEIAARLRTLMDNAAERCQLAWNQSAHVWQQYTAPVFAERLDQIRQQLMAGH